jgi:hypothetical protein
MMKSIETKGRNEGLGFALLDQSRFQRLGNLGSIERSRLTELTVTTQCWRWRRNGPAKLLI